MEKTRKNELLPAFVAEHLLVTIVTAGLLVFAGWITSETMVEEPEVTELTISEALSTPSPSPQTVFPDLSLAETVGERKRTFLDFIQDYVDEQNHLITLDRLRLIAMDGTLRNGGALTASSRDWLLDIAARYEVAETDYGTRQAWLDELLFRVDI
ncbi:MAG: hypothetical protein OXH27_06145, partial [Gammaproteobacteria bacterium]|nr:hypothetical protein [Gammaproteobacteria bacterium]